MEIKILKKVLTVVFLIFVATAFLVILNITRNNANNSLVLKGDGCGRIRREESIGKDDLKCYLKTTGGAELGVLRDCREGERGADFLDTCAYSEIVLGTETEDGQYLLETSDLITDMLHIQEYVRKEKKIEERGTFYLTRMKEGCDVENEADYSSACFDLEITQSQIEEIKNTNFEYLEKLDEVKGT